MRYYFILLIFLTMSCSDFLQDYSNELAYIKTVEDIDELLLGEAYMQVYATTELAEGSFYYPYIHFMSDETEESTEGINPTSFYNRDDIFGYYTWQQRVGINPEGTSYANESKDWERLYKHINATNNILASLYVLSNTEKSKELYNQVVGETYFLRAAYYFTLVNLYGKPYNPLNSDSEPGVPIKLSSTVDDIIFSRNTVQEVYDQIQDDLKTSEEFLEKSSGSGSIYQADITALYLFASRVYLYMQNWEKAKYYAEKVLDLKSEILDLNNFSGGFLSSAGIETIFSMGGNMLVCNITNCIKNFNVSLELFNSYNDNDLRKSVFFYKENDFIGYTKIAAASTGSSTEADYYKRNYTTPYRGTQAGVSDNFLLRTSEALLNLAEAEAYMGNETNAKETIERLRVKRIKSSEYNPLNLSGEDLIKAIRLERRLELCLEGHRWFDLRRYMVCEKYPESKRITQSYTEYETVTSLNPVARRTYTLEPFDDAYTLGIPQEAIEYNTGMEQNPRPERLPEIVTLKH